jgi:hypothetical protein
MMYRGVAYRECQCCAAGRHDNKPPDPCSADEQKERLAAPLREVYDKVTWRQDVANQQTTQPIQARHYLPDAVMRRRQEMLEQAEFNGRFQAAINALYDIASRKE